MSVNLDYFINFDNNLVYDYVFWILFIILFVVTIYKNIDQRRKINEIGEKIKINLEQIGEYGKLSREQKPQLQEEIDQKKEGFLNISTIAFHYANEDDIKAYYNDYFKEPIIEEIISERGRDVGGKIKGGASNIFEAALEGKDLNKWISTIKIPDISIAEMFRRYQRETIKNDQVTLGLDLVEIDQTDLNEFEKYIVDFKSKFNMEIDESQVERQRASLKTKAIEKTIVRLENATGWVLVEGKFKIINQSDEFYKCIYEHPVNEYFSERENNITINISLKKDSLKSNIAGNYEQSIGKYIPIIVYGKVWQPVDRGLDTWELHITPLAVY